MKRRLICCVLLISNLLLCFTGCFGPSYVEGATQPTKAYALQADFFAKMPSSQNASSQYKIIKDKSDYITSIELTPSFTGNSNYRFSAARVAVTYYFWTTDDSANATPQLTSFVIYVYLGADGCGSAKSKIEGRRYVQCTFDHFEFDFDGTVTLS